MDFSRNIVLKENYTFFVADGAGQIPGGSEHGLYNRDTRFLSRYAWSFDPETQMVRAYSPRPDIVELHYAVFRYSFQTLGVTRRITILEGELVDELIVANTSADRDTMDLDLSLGADFADMFEARSWHVQPDAGEHPVGDGTERRIVFGHVAADAVEQRTVVEGNAQAMRLDHNVFRCSVALRPAETCRLSVRVRIENPIDERGTAVEYETWRAQGPQPPVGPPERTALDRRVFARAIDDMRALLLFTPEGPVPAAGIPWFVCAFGRDALLASIFLLPWWPEPAKGTLRYLARYQARDENEYHAATPGKIMHELRFGELSRTGKVPFGPYYGTIDATPLFLMLLDELVRSTEDRSIVSELRPAWEAALTWMERWGDTDGDGFLEYRGSTAGAGQGLPIQSWKDSDDSMSHSDGSLAEGPIAPCEAQGYAHAALRAAGRLYELCDEPDAAASVRKRADELQRRFHETYWLEGPGFYAMALDGTKRPLAVKSSNVGHLLWTGIVPESHARTVRDMLFADDVWSGWGFRTLASGERRYNPMSYHNGSVWPHDTAIAAAGLARYGFTADTRRIRNVLYDLGASQPDWRVPELVAGYDRGDGPPIPYPVACRPQAWDASAIAYLLRAEFVDDRSGTIAPAR